MRALSVGFVVLTLVACGGPNNGDDDGGGDDGDGGDDIITCVGLECQVVDCKKDGKPPTTLTGTVFAPNGSLPLYGVSVYVPRDPLPPFTEGVECSRCSAGLPGTPVARVRTDEAGKFRLENVPSGDNIPLVITTGKWRRQITIPRVESCSEAALATDDTRLPKNKAEGELPKIALTTGDADSLECLIRKLGIDDREVTPDTGDGRVHFYRGNGISTITGAGTLRDATTLWSSEAKLKEYDIVFFSCESSQRATTKPQAAIDAVKAYADAGGRVFASHWHNIWISGATQSDGTGQRPAVWPEIATWTNDGVTAESTINLIDETSNEKGMAFSSWMINVAGSTTRGEIPLVDGTGRTTAREVDPARAERWTYLQGQGGYTQNFQFTTPNEQPAETRCGKVVFSDMHVGGNNTNVDKPYQAACPLTPLTPQEKAIAFMFFDIATCVGPIF